MNLIFDKKSLRVVSVFEAPPLNISDENLLRKMFPTSYQSLSVWNIDKKLNCPPIHLLKVKLGQDNFPESLYFKNKEVYKYSDDDRQKALAKRTEEQSKTLMDLLPKTLKHSISKDIINLWVRSPYTKPDITQSIKNMKYFYENRTIPVSWWGPFSYAGGYANMNRSFMFRLHNYHVIAKAEHAPSATQINLWSQHYLHKMASLDFRKLRKYPKIYGFGPHPLPPHGGKRIFYTMMETENLHPTFRDLCNNYSEEVWVPSIHNQKLLVNGGVKKPVKLMPLGIDETIYRGVTDTGIGEVKNPDAWFDILGKPKRHGINNFKFITLFGWSYRKGIDVLIKSFVRAFRGSDDVTLLIVSNHSGPDVVSRDVLRFAKEVRASDYPQILHYPHVVTEAEMPNIYKNGHVFLHTSRGEGFSLPQIEAAACNLPVISCNNTGMSQYLTDDNAYLIKSSEKELCSPEMHWISGFYHGQLFPKLGEDQVNQAVNHMHYVMNNYDVARDKGRRLKDLVFSEYTWEIATERVAKRIKEISQEN